jgi:uncharacterized protein
MVYAADDRLINEVALSQRELTLICEVLSRHPEVTTAILFGSRAKRSHHHGSDIDLALQGDVDSLYAESIAAELDDLPLPYRFDVKAYSDIRSVELLDHIHRVGVVIFTKDETF